MLTAHELFGFMSPPLAARILEHTHQNNRELYHAALTAVAESLKLRPAYFERSPRATRHPQMVSILARPRLELISANLLRDWLMRAQTAMLTDFLDALGLPHKEGAVEDLPATIDDAKLKTAVDLLLTKYPPEEAAVYLNAFYTMNDIHWPNLETMLKNDPRLQFGG